MADNSNDHRELVFCHSCQNEWYRDTHGLQCPECQSEIVEIVSFPFTLFNPFIPTFLLLSPLLPLHANSTQIDPNSDPREDRQSPPESPPDPHHHHPWNDEAPDPDEGDIDHVEWNGPGGIHFSRTTFRSSNTPQMRSLPVPDDFNRIFTSFMDPTRRSSGRGPSPGGRNGSQDRQPGLGGGFSFNSAGQGLRHGRFNTSQDGGSGSGPGGGIDSMGGRPGDRPPPGQLEDLAGILGGFLGGIHGPNVVIRGTVNGQEFGGQTLGGHPLGRGGPGTGAPPNPLALLAQMLNPANARSGDAVFTQEALDRVISNLMEQHSLSSAPGPASDTAISALPKIKIATEHLDENQKAECSICMDGLNIGDEVTELPCKHWFHGECVTSWLREHDTCPQCRRGITPKDGDANTPRTTGQAPRFWQFNQDDVRSPTGDNGPNGNNNAGRWDMPGSGSRHHPFQVPDSPSNGPGNRSRRSNQQSGRGGLGGLADWVGRRFGGHNGDGGSSR